MPSKNRKRLLQLTHRLFATDGGLETTLIFHDGMELPYFAAFDLLKNDLGLDVLRRYYIRYADVARAQGAGLVLEAPTWRANPDWAQKLGYDATTLADANRTAIGLMLEVRNEVESASLPVVISGNLGPRGDGYAPTSRMSVAEARDYHGAQVRTFAETDADMVAAFTMNYLEEAIGIALAAKASSMPVAISFTCETNGRLPAGETLAEAIERTDAQTNSYPAYYMINCAHPTHFESTLRAPGDWQQRIGGLRVNASKRSHAELDQSTDLDAGDPEALGEEHLPLHALLPNLSVVGGCCGTDHRHVESICRSLAPLYRRAHI